MNTPSQKTTRRTFLTKTGATVIAIGVGGPLLARAITEPGEEDGPRYAMVIDTRKCIEQDGCRDCRLACHKVHNVPSIPGPQHEMKWIWKESFHHAFPDQEHEFVPKQLVGQKIPVLCNHCDNPPCVRVCPTTATWQREDGIVAMDMHRCIGCRYCTVACPYGSRSFNWLDPREYLPPESELNPDFPTRTKGVVEKCNFCSEILAREGADAKPACVTACKAGAMKFGDIHDEKSDVRVALAEAGFTIRRKPGLGTHPHVFYIV
jgi:molybdopterin-containing oxidoreductase family iron-sulfur binding subunit